MVGAEGEGLTPPEKRQHSQRALSGQLNLKKFYKPFSSRFTISTVFLSPAMLSRTK